MISLHLPSMVSSGPDSVEIHISDAKYADRVLKGERPAAFGSMRRRKYQLTINPEAAMAIGPAIQQSLLSTVDEVIE